MKYESIMWVFLKAMVAAEDPAPRLAFLTTHARALVCIARDPDIRLREIGERAGVTERAAHRIVADLLAAGFVTRTRTGRRNRYSINAGLPLPDALVAGRNVGELLAALAAS